MATSHHIMYFSKNVLLESMVNGFFPDVTLTHWGRVTHIWVSKLTTIGSDKGLSPGRRQAIIWTSVGILLIGPLGTNFSEIYTFSFKKTHLKMSSVKWRPFCLGPNVLNKDTVLNQPECPVQTLYIYLLLLICEFYQMQGNYTSLQNETNFSNSYDIIQNQNISFVPCSAKLSQFYSECMKLFIISREEANDLLKVTCLVEFRFNWP